MSPVISRRFAMPDTNFWPAERVDTPRPSTSPTVAAPKPGPTPVVANELSTPRTQSEIGRRMDAFQERMGGPYMVNGKSYSVRPAFRTLYASTDTRPQIQKIKRTLGDKAFAPIAMHVARAVSSRGTPDDVRVTVQALIDAGALGKGLPTETVRALMSEFGIGFDCKGYTYRAFLHSRGTGDKPASGARYQMADAGNFDIRRTPGFSRVKIDAARTGDIIRLKPDADGREHVVIVRSNRTVTPAAGSELEVNGVKYPRSFTHDGKATKIRVMELDSSWGGGIGGGRRVWVRNESTGQWGYFPAKGEFAVSPGPYDHELDGVFRPKSE